MSVIYHVRPFLHSIAYETYDDAWHAVFTCVRKRRPSAAELLCLMRFFGSTDIPTFVLRKYYSDVAAAKAWCTNLRHRRPARDIATLRDERLVEKNINSHGLKMSDSLQSHIQTWLRSNNCLEQWQRTYLKLMADVFPTGEYENWGRCEQLLPHLSSFYATNLADTGSRESWAHIITHVAWYFWERRDFDNAKRNIDLAITLKSELLGQKIDARCVAWKSRRVC